MAEGYRTENRELVLPAQKILLPTFLLHCCNTEPVFGCSAGMVLLQKFTCERENDAPFWKCSIVLEIDETGLGWDKHFPRFEKKDFTPIAGATLLTKVISQQEDEGSDGGHLWLKPCARYTPIRCGPRSGSS